MLTITVLAFLLTLSVAQETCEDRYTDLNNMEIDVKNECFHTTCIQKCCPEGEFIYGIDTCRNINSFFKGRAMKFIYIKPLINYSNIPLYAWKDQSEPVKSKKNFTDVKLIVNQRNLVNCTGEQTDTNPFHILEDGSIQMQHSDVSKAWFAIQSMEYCLEYKLVIIRDVNTKVPTPVLKLIVREHNANPVKDADQMTSYTIVGYIISSFFLFVVFVVHCLLPKLRNLIGLVRMAYVACFFCAYVTRAVCTMAIEHLSNRECKFISPFLYFAALSGFFWLNVMSYDVFWSLRGFRKMCEINRRGELAKFRWYCLYAFGSPLLVTIIVTILDNIDLSKSKIIKPPFSNCLANDMGFPMYFIMPLGIILLNNVVLFMLTVYNIWQIRRSVSTHPNFRRSKKDTHRFITYTKLFLIMGLSWSLELLPPDWSSNIWMYILINSLNLLIGVAIFFLFIFNKTTFILLCKRFNIENDYVRTWEPSMSNSARNTKISSFRNRHRSQNPDFHSLQESQKL